MMSNPVGAQFQILLLVATSFKSVEVLHVIICQSTLDIFFVDWEAPIGKVFGLCVRQLVCLSYGETAVVQ